MDVKQEPQQQEEDEFERNIRATQNDVRAAQKERGAKEGELVVKGTLLNYWVKERSQTNPEGRNVESPTPPAVEKRPKRDKSGDYIAKVPMQCGLREMNLVEKLVEPRTDGLPGYRVKFEVSVFESAAKFLVDNAKRAWAEPWPMDFTSVRIRQYTTPDGKVLTHVWMNQAPGDSIRCTAPDKKDSLFRLPHPHLVGALKVQPLSELEFNNVVPSVYLSVSNARGPAKRAGVDEGGAGPVATVASEQRLYDNYTYVCKSNVLHREDKELMELCASERLWMLRNRDQHVFVPVEQERVTKTVPEKCYFYVSRKYMSKWAPDQPGLLPNGQGVAILRDRNVTEKDFKNVSMDGKQVFYGLLLNFTVFQWVERPNTQERYIVQAKLTREDDSVWRDMGITNPDAYAAIMLAHSDIPLHVMANFWRKASLDRPANQPDQINRIEGTENIRGYYDFIISEVIPDYLRYFRQHGMRVSKEFVNEEFVEWATMNLKTKALGVTLAPMEHTKTNPLHKLQGIGSAVISLGNGQPAPEGVTLPKGCGFNHGYAGDISALFEGKHDFYVLTSRVPPAEQQARSQSGQVVDDWLQNCISEAEASNSPFYYWIFAVAKDAKLARTPVPKVAAAPTTTPSNVPPPKEEVNAHGKRPAPADDVKEEEEVEEEEEGEVE